MDMLHHDPEPVPVGHLAQTPAHVNGEVDIERVGGDGDRGIRRTPPTRKEAGRRDEVREVGTTTQHPELGERTTTDVAEADEDENRFTPVAHTSARAAPTTVVKHGLDPIQPLASKGAEPLEHRMGGGTKRGGTV